MANTNQARKRARQSDRRRAHNTSLRSSLRTAIKRAREAVDSGNPENARKVFEQSVSVIDRIADKKIIHKNKAARHKSRLAAQLKLMGAGAPSETPSEAS